MGGLLWFWAIWPKVPTPPKGGGRVGGGVRNLDGEWSQKVAKISGTMLSVPSLSPNTHTQCLQIDFFDVMTIHNYQTALVEHVQSLFFFPFACVCGGVQVERTTQ